jgi:hypothetical protein
MIASKEQRRFCIPYADFASGTAFHQLSAGKFFDVPCPYRETQDTIVRFLADGLAGRCRADPRDPTVK